MKVALLVSGGMDSRIMLHYAKLHLPGARLVPIWYDYGQRAARAERAHLPSGTLHLELPWIDGPCAAPGYVVRGPSAGYTPLLARLKADAENAGRADFTPGRNLVLAVHAACYTMADEVWLGGLIAEAEHPDSTDKNFRFCEQAGDLLTYVLSPHRGRVTVRMPLAESKMRKADAMDWALRNGMALEDLFASWSCYGEGPEECGKCKQCRVRADLRVQYAGFR